VCSGQPDSGPHQGQLASGSRPRRPSSSEGGRAESQGPVSLVGIYTVSALRGASDCG